MLINLITDPFTKSVVQKLVPEDSATPETRTLVILNGHKGFVGIFKRHSKDMINNKNSS